MRKNALINLSSSELSCVVFLCTGRVLALCVLYSFPNKTNLVHSIGAYVAHSISYKLSSFYLIVERQMLNIVAFRRVAFEHKNGACSAAADRRTALAGDEGQRVNESETRAPVRPASVSRPRRGTAEWNRVGFRLASPQQAQRRVLFTEGPRGRLYCTSLQKNK